ncbi:hypothetical protein IAU59_004446 [Kwoniella sp. CBS 9459]
MRATATFTLLTALLVSASGAIAAPSPIPVKSDSIDKKVASYETPKKFHQDCDVHNVQCKAMNEDVYGTANYGEGAAGKQAGHVAQTGSEVAAIEGQSDLAKTLATDGPVVQHDLQGRDHGHSEYNEALKETSHDAYPVGLLSGAGDFVEKQGVAAETAGKGANTVGKDGNKQAKTLSKGEKGHSNEVVNAVLS